MKFTSGMSTTAHVLLTVLVFVVFGATVEAVRIRSIREGDREAMRIGIEDVARRVRVATANLATVTELNNRGIIAKARAFAEIIAKDPTIVDDHERFASYCKTLDVDELHVSDEKGILIQCVPTGSLGFDMNSSDQPRPFMRALTDKNFEMVQDPSIKPTDGKSFQYAGVARIDKTGIVQVGQRADRVQEARNLADIQEIATSTRIGRNGKVHITSLTGSRGGAHGFQIQRISGERFYTLASTVGAYRVHVMMPLYGIWIGDDIPFLVLCILDALVVILVLLTRLESVRAMFGRNLHALTVLFRGVPAAEAEGAATRRGAAQRMRRLANPMVLACGAMFACSVVVCWLIFSHTARVAAQERLLNAAQDMHDDIDGCVDQQLFYQGNAICKSYGTPEAMTVDAVKEIMRRYDLDELNVIDARGIIIAGDLAEVGFDMASNPNSRKFNRLLEGETTYSQPFRGAIENPSIRRKYAGVAFPPPAKGYIQIGFAESRLKDGLDYRFAAIAKDWRIGDRGFFVVAKDETGEIDSCGRTDSNGKPSFKPGDTLAGIGFDVSAAPEDPHEFFMATLYGEKCLCLSEVISFHRCVAAMPVSEISGGFRRTIITTAAVLFGIFLLVTIFMIRLSDLVTSLKGYIEEAARRVEKDMLMAKTIQSNVLPKIFPPYPNLVDRIDLHAWMLTAKEVGGDFYDFYFVERSKLALVIADVSGKGVPAALFMMRAKAIIQASLKGGMEITAAVQEANDRLSESNEANMFVTAWIGIVNIDTGLVEYVNAGHNPPLVKRADGSVNYLTERSGPPLASLSGVPYRRKEMALNAGDGILLYTDGVTEATNNALELYGEPRLVDTLKGLLGAHDSKGVIEGIVASVHDFVAGAEQSDDITLLAFKLRRKD